ALEKAGLRATVTTLRGDGQTLAAMHVAGIDGLTTYYVASVKKHLGAIGEGVFHRIGVEILVHVRHAAAVLPVVAAAQSLGLDRPRVLHPAQGIQDMDIIVTVHAAAGPQEAMETLHLVIQLADIRRFGP